MPPNTELSCKDKATIQIPTAPSLGARAGFVASNSAASSAVLAITSSDADAQYSVSAWIGITLHNVAAIDALRMVSPSSTSQSASRTAFSE
jgi:hypothetical protein